MQQVFVVVWRFAADRRPHPDDKNKMMVWAEEQRTAGMLGAWGWGASPICRNAMAILTVSHMAEVLDLVMHCPVSKLCKPEIFEWVEASLSVDAMDAAQ